MDIDCVGVSIRQVDYVEFHGDGFMRVRLKMVEAS